MPKEIVSSEPVKWPSGGIASLWDAMPTEWKLPLEAQMQPEFGITLVDVGGTKENILVVGVDRKGNLLEDKVVVKGEMPSPVRNLGEGGDVKHFYDLTDGAIKGAQAAALENGVKVLPIVCVGTPGRLIGGRIAPGSAGNLGRNFDGVSPEEELSQRLGQKVSVINDALAQMGAGLRKLLATPEIGEELRGKKVGYVGPGTGLGGGFCTVNDDLSLTYFTDGHIYDVQVPEYTGTARVGFGFLAERNYGKPPGTEHHTLVIPSRFAEDVLSGRAVGQIMRAIDRRMLDEGKGPLFLPLVEGYGKMDRDEINEALGHGNLKSPVNAELLNRVLGGDVHFDRGFRERALKSAGMIAEFEGEMLGRLIGQIYNGQVKKANDDAQWPPEDRERVKGITHYLIGGSVGTKGPLGKIVREEAVDYLNLKFPGVEFNLYAVEEAENAGALGTAAFLERDEILEAMERIGE